MAAQAISPISMKLGQFEEVYPNLLQSKFKEIWSKVEGVDHPLIVFFFFFNKNGQKSPKKMVKSIRLYSYKNSTKSFQIFRKYCPIQRKSIVDVSFFYD